MGVKRELVCKRCNKDFSAFVKTKLPLYCDECSKALSRAYSRQWKILNPQKAREMFHKWYAEHLKAPVEVDVVCRSCGAVFLWTSKRKKKCDYCLAMEKRDRIKRWKELNPDKVLEQKRRARARKRAGVKRRVFREGSDDSK